MNTERCVLETKRGLGQAAFPGTRGRSCQSGRVGRADRHNHEPVALNHVGLNDLINIKSRYWDYGIFCWCPNGELST